MTGLMSRPSPFFSSRFHLPDSPQRKPMDPRGGTGAFGLSAITFVEQDQYLAVSDRAGDLFELRIQIDPESGTIVASKVLTKVPLASARDAEGIALGPSGSVWVCDEVGPAVRRHRIEDGSIQDTLEVPPVFAGARRNLSLEAIAVDPGRALWIANEEALRSDGPKSTADHGSRVRLQRFEPSPQQPADWVPAGQWAYETDPIPGEPMGGFARSGVVDMVSVPGGPLLLLERGLGSGGIRARIYSVDRSGATDTSARAALTEAAHDHGPHHLPSSRCAYHLFRSTSRVTSFSNRDSASSFFRYAKCAETMRLSSSVASFSNVFRAGSMK